MRLIFWILGLGAIAVGIYSLVTIDEPGESCLLCCSASGICLVTGLLYSVAGAKNYRGDWSFVVGVVFLSFALLITAGIAFGQFIKGPDDKVLASVLLGFLFPCGPLSLWSAQRLHGYSIEAEAHVTAASKWSTIVLHPDRAPDPLPCRET